MKNIETKKPNWWTSQHTSGWDRVKEAFRRDWEQTKADLSKTKGEELNQDAGDTIKQAVGKEPLPPPHVANPENEWNNIEPALSYGYGSRTQYSKHSKWDDDLEKTLERDWQTLGSEQTWSDVRSHVRRGFERDNEPANVGSGDGPEVTPRRLPNADSSSSHRRP